MIENKKTNNNVKKSHSLAYTGYNECLYLFIDGKNDKKITNLSKEKQHPKIANCIEYNGNLYALNLNPYGLYNCNTKKTIYLGYQPADSMCFCNGKMYYNGESLIHEIDLASGKHEILKFSPNSPKYINSMPVAISNETLEKLLKNGK